MVTIDDCECVSRLLRNTISMLCENSVKYSKGLKIEGILAITVDLKTIFIVHVDETLERGDEHVAVVGEARSHASSVSPRTYRPPAAKRLAIMPPPAIRSVELAVPEMPSRSVSTWPVKCSAAADRNPVTFPSAQKLVHTVRGQLVFRGRRVPLVSRGSRVTGPRFPIGRPRLIVPDSHKVKCMPRMPCGPKTIARITFNPSLRSHLPVSPGRSGVLQRLPVQSPKNLSSSNLSQKSQVVARTTLFAPENCKVVASHQTAMSANVVSIDHIPVKQRLAVTLPAQEQKTHRDIERDQSSIQHQSGMQMLAVKHRPLHPDGQKQFIQRSADVLQSPNRNVQQLLEPRLGDQRQLFSTAGRVLTVEQASRGRQPLGQTVHQSLRVPQHSKEQQHRGQRDQLAAHPLQTRHLIHPVFHARASQPVNVVGGQVPSVCLSLRQLQPPSQRVQGKPAICLMEESQHPTNQQLRRTPSLKPSTSDQTVVKQVASEIPDYKRLHSQQMIMEKSVRQLSNAELDGGKPLPTGLCTAQTATVGQPSFCAVNQPHGKKVNVLQSVNQPVTVQSTVASGNHSKPVQPVMVVMTRALNQPLSVKLTSVETTANSFQRINNKLPNTSMQLPLWSLKQMVPQQQGICRQTSLDITGHDNPLLSPITKPEKMPSVGFAKLPQTSVNSAGGLRSISSLLSLQCAQGYPASVQLSTPTTLTSSTVQLPHVSVFSRPATVSYETFLPSLLQEQQMSSDFHMAANQSSCISALNPYQFTQPSSTEPSHSTFAGQPKGTSHLSRSLSLPNPSVSLSPFSPVAPAVAWSGVLVKSVESATVPSRQQLKAQVEFSGNHNLENLYSHQSKTSESQHELMPKTIQQLIMKPQDKGHEVQEQQAPRHNIQQQEVPVQNQLCTASLSQGQQLQHIDKKNKLIQQQYQSCAEPQQQMLSQRQLQTQMPQGQAEMSKMANELSQQCLVPADELPQPYFISGKDTGDKNQYSEWCRQFVHEQVQKLRELQVPGQEHNKTCQTGRNQADMPKADKVSESLSQDKHNDFPSSAVSHHQQAVCSMSQMSLACDVACPTAVSASTRDCSLSTVDTEELPDVSQELLNSVLSHSSSVLYKHDTPVKLASKTTGIKAKSVASSDNNGDVPAYPPYSQVNVLSKPADTHPDVRESQIVLSGESQKLQTSSQIKDSVRTSLLAAGTHRVSQFTAGEGPLPCNLPNVGADCRPIPPQLADGQLFVLPEELEQLKQQPLNDLGKQTVESHTDEVNHQQTVDQVQQLLSSEFRGDEFDDLNLSCSANVDDECHSSDSEATILSTWQTSDDIESENAISLQLELSDSELFKCKAYGCQASFGRKLDLAEHYCSMHVCYGGPPNDALGQHIYSKCLAAFKLNWQNTMKSELRCDICGRVLKSSQGLHSHKILAHGNKLEKSHRRRRRHR